MHFRLSFSSRLESVLGLRELLLRSGEVGVRLRRGRQVLVGIEATDSSDVSNIGELQETARLILVVVVAIGIIATLAGIIVGVVVISVVLVTSVSAMVLALGIAHLLRHRRQSHTFRQVGKRIDEASLLFLVVVE